MEANKKETNQVISDLSTLPLSNFSWGFYRFLLGYVESGVMKQDLEYGQQMAAKIENIPNRNSVNLAILGMGVRIIQRLFKRLELAIPFNEQDILDAFNHIVFHVTTDAETDLDLAMSHFAEVTVKSFSTDKIKYEKKEGKLYIAKKALETAIDIASRQKGLEGMLPNGKQLKFFLNSAEEDNGSYVLAEKTDSKNINGKTQRCYIFDVNRLEMIAGIDTDHGSTLRISTEKKRRMRKRTARRRKRSLIIKSFRSTIPYRLKSKRSSERFFSFVR